MTRAERPASAVGRKYVILGIVVLLASYLPLELSILLGPSDGNPVGFGILYMLGAPAGAITALIGAVQWALAAVMERR